MAQKTDLNVSPYYDDFAEDKSFHRILFKPSAAIQARELTQLQSILQNQIERFGSHMFKEGAIILGARTSYDNQYFGVRVEDTNPNGSGVSATESFRVDSLNKFFKGQTSGVVGKVVNTSAKTTEDSLTLHIKYQATGNSGSTFYKEFQDGEILDEVQQDSDGLGGYSTVSSNNQFKVLSIPGSTNVGSMAGSAASISEGIIYTRGMFVQVPAQTIILEKYSNTPSYKVGVDIAETFTTYTEDNSLLDNAAGSSNENAPGADRLKVQLILAKKSLTATDSTDFIELMRLAGGEVVRKQEITEYNRIQETLARRTFDESGDYTLQPFTLAFREHLNDLSNNGVYTSTSSPTGDESKFITVVSAGKSYVRGFEVDKQTPSFITFDKARTTASKDNVASAFRIGNFLKINNVYGLPDIGDAGDLSAFSTVTLMDTAKGSVASDDGGGNKIGFARVRAYEQFDTSSDALHLFDVQMFTKLTTASVSLSKGMKVKGTVSGATGIVAEAVSSGTTVLLHSVVGQFNTSDTIRKIQNSSGGVAINGSASEPIRTYDIGRIRRVHQDRGTGVFQEFGGDVVLEDSVTLTGSAFGTVDGDSANDTITGVASKFTSELIEGDNLLFPDGSTATVVSVTDNDTAVVTDLSASFNGTVVRQRAQFYKPDQTVAISGLPNSGIKDISIETEIVRREVIVQSSGTGICTVTSSDGTFVDFNEDDYHASRSDTGAKIALTQSAVSISNGSNTGTVNIDVGVNNINCKVIVTVQRGSVTESSKTLIKGAVLNVNTANSTSNYGTSYQHNDITLGVSDVFAVRGIFEGGNAVSSGGATASTAPVPPSFTYTADSGSNALSTGGTEVVGSVSNARGIVIENDSNTVYFYYKKGSGKFQSGEGITFTDGTEKSGVISNLSNGSKEITDNFVFDDGQRDGFYDVSKITRKASAPAPNNPLMIVMDFFTHSGGGNVFTGNSYGTMAFDEVPSYVADRFDPSASFDADGEFHLADSIDYRPVAARLLSTQPSADVSSPQNISGISALPMSYSSTAFEGNGSFNPDLAKIGSNITVDYDHYLARLDRLFLTALGEFVVVTGEPSDVPKKGAKVDNAIEVAEIFVPAYTPDVGEIQTQLVQHRRYTMRDIDGIQRRLTQLETAVSLSMLEEKTETLQVLDDEGFDKFKSGFVVDPFKGHGVGDVFHPDYGIAVDQREGIARPSHRTNYFDMQFNSGISSNITRSGDLLTLPFTEEAHITSNKASQQVNVNPYDVANFVGRMELSPDKDVWHDMEQLPSITTSQEGNFDAVLAGVEVGTVWNDWQQTWAGVPTVTQQVGNFLENNMLGDEPEEFELLRGRRFRRRRRNIRRGRGRRAVTTTTTRTIPTRERRSGIVTNVVEDITTTRNDRVVGVSAINFMRSIDITISGELLKPNTALNVFFDNINVNAHCTPSSGTYGVGGATAKGTKLKTDNQGKLSAVFTVPNDDTLRFETGIRTLKVTDTDTVDSLLSTTSAFTNFMANGSLTSTQTEVVSTRNGRVTTESVNEGRANQIVNTSTTTRWVDPLAQSFLIEKEEGVFINSIEVFFSAKDGGGLPVTCSIRQMLNGAPTQKVLPFAEKTLYPSEVNVSANAQTATKFTFPAPVYLNPNTEYCFVLESNSNAYLTWVGQMGDFDVHTKEPIDRQPYAGVLFKSQNSSTWTPEQLQDLKFTINRCKFSSTSGKVVLENKAIPSKKLKSNPIEVIGTGDRDRIKIFHQSHGMYDGDSNVVISGVEGDKDNGILSVTTNVTGTGATGSYTEVGGTSGGDGEGQTFNITLDTNTNISAITINNPGYNFAVGEQITIPQSAVGGSGATTFATITVASVEDTLGGIPIGKINTTHTAIQSYDLDSYEINVSLGSHLGGTDNVRGGGVNVLASENMYFDVVHTLVPNVIYPKTSLGSELFKTSTNQPQGTANSYSLANASQTIVLNDNNFMVTSGIVASQINETNEMGSAKSFKLELDMTTTSDFVSPVVDVGSIGANTIMNRIDSVSSSNDLATNTNYIASTEPEGDNNSAIYCTRVVQLENPATQLKVIFDGFKPAGTALGEIKTYYKLLKADNTLPTEELGWTEFDTTNVPDADSSKFRSYEYDADNLEEFLGFAVKVVMKSKDTTQPCAIRAFRGLALA